MYDSVWVLDSEKDSSFGNMGISGSYIIPRNEISFDPKTLAGNRLWVVLRGHEDRLFALIKIKKIERIIEGYHSGDYLISSELTGSFKLVSGYKAATKYKISDTRGLKLGVSDLGLDIFKAFIRLVKASIQIKLSPPVKRLLSQIDFQLLPNNNRQLARSALRAVISRLTLDQIWANGIGDKLGAFPNFAYALVNDRMVIQQRASLVRELNDIDPLSAIFALETLRSQEHPPKYTNPPCVDTEFCAIDPEKIYAREFLSADSTLRDFKEALIKTEHAEKIHQAMVRDISVFLIDRGITPYESGSIDLMYRIGDELNVFEIKSTSTDNILSQAAKGAFQLACYLNELSKDYDNLEIRLILQKTESYDLQSYVKEVLTCLGVEVLVYDPSKPWPRRIQGMPL